MIITRFIVNLFSALISLWIIAFFWFLTTMPKTSTDTKTIADAAIVLTGGNGRVKLGHDLITKGLAKKLFITGVNRSVHISHLKKLQHLENSNIVAENLGYDAVNTSGNAIEAAKWVSENNIKTVRLVTTDYHMKRSVLEFKSKMPKISIIEDPVAQTRLMNMEAVSFLIQEFHKYLGVVVKYGVFLVTSKPL